MTSPRKKLGSSNDPRLLTQELANLSRAFPSIPELSGDNIQEVVKALREAVEQLTGFRGETQLNAVLAEDLEALGLINIWENGYIESITRNRVDYLYGPRELELSIYLTAAKAGGVKAPTWAKVTDDGAGSPGIYAWRFSSGTEEELFLTVHLGISYTEGTNVDLDIHWLPTTANTGNIVWGIEYVWANVGANPGTTSTIETAIAAPGATVHVESHIAELPGAGKQEQSIIALRIYRKSADAADTYPNPVFANALDVHGKKTIPESDVEHS